MSQVLVSVALSTTSLPPGITLMKESAGIETVLLLMVSVIPSGTMTDCVIAPDVFHVVLVLNIR